jgi:hypothetical protein
MIDGLINCMSDVSVSLDDVEGLVSFHVEVELWVVEFLADSLHWFRPTSRKVFIKTHLDHD